ncbi:MAG TPA: FtsX-like permease family protein, partial [Terriglobales bacterium]|nr:FtsX-like permease family protein [Terriglobales bacterium]
FSTFAVNPYLGGTFGLEDEQPGRAPRVIVSYRYWQKHLNADPAFIGKTLSINGQSVTLIGVVPEGFLGASPFLFAADLWMPLSVGPAVAPELSDDALHRTDVQMFRVVVRLQPGITRDQAEAALDAVTQQLQQDNAQQGRERKGRRLFLVDGGKMLPLREQDQPFFTSFLLLIAGLVVVIACANVANMMLARALDRRAEIAIRLSLGASRARLVRQLVTENMIIATAAGAIGFGLSFWLTHLLSRLRMPFPMPVAYNFEPDGRVLLLTMIITLSTGLLFGLAPALQATGTEIIPALKAGRTVSLRRFRSLNLRNLLMISQMAGSLTLLVLLGLLSLGIQTTMGMEAGFDAQNLYLIHVDPIRDGYPRDHIGDFFQKLLDRVQNAPGIKSACLTETVPVSLASRGVTFSVSAPAGQQVLDSAAKHLVGKDYFGTTGIPIHLGRVFTKADEANNSVSVIVSEALAQRAWNGENPVGHRIEIGNAEIVPPKILPGSFDYRSEMSSASRKDYEVVGVAGDVAEGLVVQKPRPAIYFPLRPADYDRPSLEGVTIVVRATPGTNAITVVRQQIATVSQQVTPFNALTMREHIEQFMSPLRAAAWTYGLVGVFGLVLASIGLAGVTAYSVRQRRHELAVRLAIGAQPRDVIGLVIKDGAYLVLAGTTLGMSCAWMGEHALTAMSATVGKINSTTSSNPLIIIGAPLLLAFLALIACYWPARKSTQINPVTALRQE